MKRYIEVCAKYVMYINRETGMPDSQYSNNKKSESYSLISLFSLPSSEARTQHEPKCNMHM